MDYNETNDPHKGAIMNAAKRALTRTQNFVSNHKTVLAVTATAAAGIALNVHTVRGYHKFLESKGLLEEFLNIAQD